MTFKNLAPSLLLSAFALQSHTLCSQSLSNGLVVCYLMDGNSADSGPNGLNGITTASAANDRNGVPGGALAFNGSNSYFDLPSNPILKPSFPFTVSLWMKATANTGGLYTSDYEDNVYDGFWVALNSDGTININCGDGGPIGSGSRSSEFSYMVFQLNQWYLLTAVFHSAMDMDLYVGCDQTSTYHSGQASSLYYGSSSGSLGRHDSMLNGPPGYFSGMMDEVALWNRALSNAEIQMLCAGQLSSAVSVIEQPLVIGGQLNVHPNPTKGQVTVTTPSTTMNGPLTYSVVDVRAEQVATGNLNFEGRSAIVDISGLAAGNYWIMVEDGSLQRRTAMITVAP